MSTRWPMSVVAPLLGKTWTTTVTEDQGHSLELGAAAARKMLQHARDDVMQRLGVQVEVADFQVADVVPDDATRTDDVTLHWMPQNCPIEIFGGEHDGQVMPWPRVGEDIVLMRAPRVPSLAQLDDPPEVKPSDNRRYRLAGWAPHSRRWVYAPR